METVLFTRPPSTENVTSEINAVVLGGNRFPFHRLETLGPVIRRSLEKHGITTELTTDRNVLRSHNLVDYDVLVDYTTDSTFTDAQVSGLLSFVERGGGYAGLHCASDLTTGVDTDRDEPVPELRALIGGHFLDHPEQGTFDVNVVDTHHPVSAGLEDFSVWDEPYAVEYDDDIQVLARMDHYEHGDMPVSWVRSRGDGRVFYCSLGHDRPALTNDGVRSLFLSGVRWVAE